MEFKLFTNLEIEKNSVFEITSHKAEIGTFGGIYDHRLGSINGVECATCNQISTCAGHMAFVKLCIPVLNPLLYKHIIIFLKLFCFECNVYIIDINDVQKNFVKTYQTMLLRFENNACKTCGKKCGKITYNRQDNHKITMNGKQVFQKEIIQVLDLFDDNIVEHMKCSSPKSFYFINLPVLPINNRVVTESGGVRVDADPTIIYIDIIKKNNKIKEYNLMIIEDPSTAEKLNVLIHVEYKRIIYKLQYLFDNSLTKCVHSNNRLIVSIKENISGKCGLIRNTILGKRVANSARSVISPGVGLKINEIGVPMHIAKNLTNKMYVSKHNISAIRKQIRLDQKDFGVSDNVINDDTLVNTSDCKYIYKIINGNDRIKIDPNKIQVGDCLEKVLENGDLVFVNRQPTLSTSSFFALKAKIHGHKTIQMPLSLTESYNADFDGDECNLHLSDRYNANVEQMYCSTVESNFFNFSTGKSNVCVVQDSVIALFNMSNTDKIDLCFLNEFVMNFPTICNDIDYKHLYAGSQLLQLVFENYTDLNFKYTKNNINGVITNVAKVVGTSKAIEISNRILILTNIWINFYGYSVTVSDFRVDIKDVYKYDDDKIISKENNRVLYTCNDNSDSDSDSDSDGDGDGDGDIDVDNLRIVLNNNRNMHMRNFMQQQSTSNKILQLILSGAKGKLTNFLQLFVNLGQTMPIIKQREYGGNVGKIISQGYILSNFVHGISKAEYLNHSIIGRDAIIASSLSTSSSGYLNRKVISLCANLKNDYLTYVRDDEMVINFKCPLNSYLPQNSTDTCSLISDIAMFKKNIIFESAANIT